jgi:8-oxo-dGTP pyrophosphatase MutT (NUDIX family)
MDDKLIKKKPKFYCGNCGKFGHLYKYCNEPITSFGVILLSVSSDDDKIIPGIISNYKGDDTTISSVSVNNTEGITFNDNADMEIFGRYKDNIKFLLIQRKHTLGYIEFMRGRYNIENVEGIIFLFKQMTPDEIEKISNSTFDELWNDLWSNNKNKLAYHTEYTHAKYKFEKLKKETEQFLNLNFYIENVTPIWNYPEWGFPKGRRNYQEDNIKCAVREFMEESGFAEDDFILLDKIAPIEEHLIGTNGVSYKHIYYIALSCTDKLPKMDPNNKSQFSEIGGISWCTFDESIKLLRSHHVERRRLLEKLYMYIMNGIISASHQ